MYVQWEDSAGTHGWQLHRDGQYGTVMCHSVGWMVEKSKNRVVMALNWNEGQIGEIMTIPKSAVRKMKRLR